MWLLEIYDNYVKKITDTWENQISYEEWWKYSEYTEWYAFRDWNFKEKVIETLERPYYKKVFLIVLSAIFSSSNEEEFLNLLNKYSSRFFAEKFCQAWEDLIEKKTIFSAELDFISDDWLKNFLLMNSWNWRKYENNNLKKDEETFIHSIVQHVYDKIDERILQKFQNK